MTWMGTKRIDDIRKDVETLLSHAYKCETKEGVLYFSDPNGGQFHICRMGEEEPWNALVIEYMDTMEDGDLFYPEDYGSLEALVAEMRKEIESTKPST